MQKARIVKTIYHINGDIPVGTSVWITGQTNPDNLIQVKMPGGYIWWIRPDEVELCTALTEMEEICAKEEGQTL